MAKITKLLAREILDSRGFPTVEVDLWVEHCKTKTPLMARAMVPSGASTGEGEALELRDQDHKRFMGKGVMKAISNIREKIAPAIIGREFPLVALLDDVLLDLDGTSNKSKLGANAVLAVSLAFTKAHAAARDMTTDELIADTFGSQGRTLPVPMMNILNGGKHADNGLAVQEFMIVPAGFSKFSDSLRAGVEVFHRLKKILADKGLSTAVGDEGGFAPIFTGARPHEQAMLCIMQAIGDAGYQPGKQIYLALDCAASEFADSQGGYAFEKNRLSSIEMTNLYTGWVNDFPIVSIEDGFSEHDWVGWKWVTEALGNRCQLVGDDLFVTNCSLLQQGIDKKVANAVLIKPNQIGCVTETLETMKLAAKSGYRSIVSHRSGETEDTFIADLAVGTDCGQIKTGSASRTDRTAKYNQLLRIEERLGQRAQYLGRGAFAHLADSAIRKGS